MISWPALSSTTWAFPWLQRLELVWKWLQCSLSTLCVLLARGCTHKDAWQVFCAARHKFAKLCVVLSSVVYFTLPGCVWAAFGVPQWIHYKRVSLFHTLSLASRRVQGHSGFGHLLALEQCLLKLFTQQMLESQDKALTAFGDHLSFHGYHKNLMAKCWSHNFGQRIFHWQITVEGHWASSCPRQTPQDLPPWFLWFWILLFL